MYTLHHGIHRGTITSRDTTSKKYETEEKARVAFIRSKEFYEGIGYKIWFAYIIGPDGSKIVLDSGNADYC